MKKKDENWTPFKLGCVWGWEGILRSICTSYICTSCTNFTKFCNNGDSIYCLHKNKYDGTVRVTFKTKNKKYYIKIMPFAEFYMHFWDSVDFFIQAVKENTNIERGMERPMRKGEK
jgi:hypothetical protein